MHRLGKNDGTMYQCIPSQKSTGYMDVYLVKSVRFNTVLLGNISVTLKIFNKLFRDCPGAFYNAYR